MFKDLREKDYGERLKSLNLWTLEERRNRQDLIEVFKMCKDLQGTRGHTLSLKKKQSVKDVRRYFFQGEW